MAHYRERTCKLSGEKWNQYNSLQKCPCDKCKSKIKPPNLKLKPLLKSSPKCKICKTKYTPKNNYDETCSETDCRVKWAMQVVEKQKEAKRKKEKSELKEKVKTKSNYENELQKEINTIVRLIDYGSICHSTLKPLNYKYDAGHFMSCGSNPTIRFNLFNIYSQSVHANRYLSGDQINFMNGLSEIYGVECKDYVLSLKGLYSPLKLTIDDLKEKISLARQVVKHLKLENKIYSATERLELRKEYNAFIGIYEN